ncbi:hypothetical protein TIFTF001_037810 [Ficus carica]|uniref:(R)-mandelonitrile lyase n=1 Tax=Ficus carica TaxID=3494 RepID=A0AA88JCH9_FICCA|nr:hypothetical protein TIFTF001_037810 [Ficus carica]
MAPSTALFVAFLIFFSFQGQLPQVQALANRSDHDFSYMKSVKNATDMPSEEEYDYIVIGGGTAGCPLDATLSEEHSVLVLERGGAPETQPNVLSVAGFFANLMQEDDGKTPAQRFTSEDGVANVRGRVLGGSSMINAGFYSRADNEFLSKSGVDWDMDAVEKAYQWVEETIVFHPSSLAVWQSAFKEALVEAGVVPDNGFRLDHVVGTKVSGSIFDGVGKRHGAVELLNRGNLKNLRVALHAVVEKIIFSTVSSSKPSAVGVIYSDANGKFHRALVRDKGEIILSAGAIGSPQLLLLSGVGSESYLSSLNIPVIHSQPNVGEFMADNPRNNINLVIPFPFASSPAQVVGITSDYFIETVSYSLSFFPIPLPFSLFPTPASTEVSIATIAEKTTGLLSHGSLRLSSPNEAKATPLVRFNYFSDPVDLSRCVKGVRKMGDMMNTNSMDRFKYTGFNGERGFMFLGPALPSNWSDDLSVEDYCQSTVTTFWHYHGGCLVGKVVDGDFRVMGINSLRVVDGSTFTISPGTNPQATLMMLGR